MFGAINREIFRHEMRGFLQEWCGDSSTIKIAGDEQKKLTKSINCSTNYSAF